MAGVVTVAAGEAIPAPPAGHAWVFARAYPSGSLALEAVPHPDGQPDPTPPSGCTWRVVTVRGVHVYIATPAPFLHHPLARQLVPDLA